MTKGEMIITRYGDLAIKVCLDYHKLQSKQAKNVAIQKVHFLFLFFFFFCKFGSYQFVAVWF